VSGTSKPLSPQDLLFLYGETPILDDSRRGAGAFHSAGRDSPSTICEQMFEDNPPPVVAPGPVNLKLSHLECVPADDRGGRRQPRLDYPTTSPGSALASPGDDVNCILSPGLHSHPSDFTRPPWELALHEGLEGGRFAIYMKIHHSAPNPLGVDCYTGNKFLSVITQHVDRPATQGPSRLFFDVGAATTKPRMTACHAPVAHSDHESARGVVPTAPSRC